MSITPIETVYKGYRFRSRLEARWAVFFDTLDVPYEYEKEGFDLGDGVRYLPDFWLPDHNCWIEIKPTVPADAEMRKPGLLAANSGNWVDILYGGPWPGAYGIVGLRSLRPEFAHPRLMHYVELAFERQEWWMLNAIYRAYPQYWWRDVEERAQHAQGLGPALYDRWPDSMSYRIGHFVLELCPRCQRLLFGHPAHFATVPRLFMDDDGTIIEDQEPFEIPHAHDWCPICHVEGDANHASLIAAYTAARQARFEYGARP